MCQFLLFLILACLGVAEASEYSEAIGGVSSSEDAGGISSSEENGGSSRYEENGRNGSTYVNGKRKTKTCTII